MISTTSTGLSPSLRCVSETNKPIANGAVCRRRSRLKFDGRVAPRRTPPVGTAPCYNDAMKILIAGCGYLGTLLGQDLARSGHEVWGLRRDGVALREIEKLGVRPVQANLLSFDSLKNLPAVDHVVLCQAPTKKNDDYRSTYFEATKNLLEALPKGLCRKIILISSTSVYSTRDGSWVDEMTDPIAGSHGDREASENAKALLDAESLILNSTHPSVVLRLSGVYGEGRNRVKSILDGRVKPVFSDVYMNRIHATDIVRAIRLLLEKGLPREIYLGSDDAPSTQKEFYSWVFDRLSMPIPVAGENEPSRHGQSNKRCSNKKIKELGLKLRYPSFKEGYAPLIAEIASLRSQ